MINIEPIKAFNDNYIWLVTTNEGSIAIDPGESLNTINFLEENQLNLKAVLITHHHFDHTGGIDDLLSYSPVDVYGPSNNIASIDKKLKDGDKIISVKQIPDLLDQLFMLTKSGMMIRLAANQTKETLGKVAKGTRIMELRNSDKTGYNDEIIFVARLPAELLEEDNETESEEEEE